LSLTSSIGSEPSPRKSRNTRARNSLAPVRLASAINTPDETFALLARTLLAGFIEILPSGVQFTVRWPHLVVVLTSGNPGPRLVHMPPGVEFMPKPWEPAQLLGIAERAVLGP